MYTTAEVESMRAEVAAMRAESAELAAIGTPYSEQLSFHLDIAAGYLESVAAEPDSLSRPVYVARDMSKQIRYFAGRKIPAPSLPDLAIAGAYRRALRAMKYQA